ncbi:MAG: hypothetical protein LAT51_01090 [Flavobacteriaceae bacterium]|nr:hypothetical protein [Flavobacteriaceae bacterium]
MKSLYLMSELEELYNKKIISTRTHNICLVNKLDSLEKLHRFYKKKGSFISLKNCGHRSNLELIDVCTKFVGKNQLDEVEGFCEVDLTKIIVEMSYKEKQLLQVKIKTLINQLDNRTKNALSLYLKHDFSIENLIESEVLVPYFSIDRIRGLGYKSGKLAQDVLVKIRLLIIEVDSSQNPFTQEETKSIYLKYLPSEELALLQFSYDYYFENCERLLQSKTLFNQEERVVIKYGLLLYENQTYLSAKEIALKTGMNSREVALIKQKVINKIKKKFLFLKEFRSDFETKNRIETEQDILVYPDYIFEKVRDLHGVNFSNQFISFLIGLIFCETHKNVGYYKSCLSKLVKKRIKFNSKYHFKTYHQVDLKLGKKCNFSALISHIFDHQIQVDNLTENQKIELVSRFTTTQFPKTKLRLLNCAQQILERENLC